MEYDFKKIEDKWQKEWKKERIFEVKEYPKKIKYYVLEMFPYPSGEGLHMGHTLNYTIGDIFARFKRMQGFNVLYPMGFDSFGLPAENAAIKSKTHPKKFTENAISNYIKQLKEIGLSYDWSRIIETHKSEYYKWNQFFFLKFLEKDLIYRKKAPVNFCSKCNTVLANEQVHNGKCWRHKDTNVTIKHLEQWFIKTTKYTNELLTMIDKLNWPERIKIMQKNWIGKSYGTEIIFEVNGEPWRIFTTRPDTVYGVTFMVISTQHPKIMEIVTKGQKPEIENFLKEIRTVSDKDFEELEKKGVFTGSYAINPLTDEKIPVYAGNFVVADYGSGMVMAVPAHDQRDFEFAKKYKLPIKEVIQENTKIITIEESLKQEFYKSVEKFAKITKKDGLCYIFTERVDEVFRLAKNNFIGSPWYIHSEGKIKKIMFHSNKEDKIFYSENLRNNKESKDFGLKIGIKKEQLDYDELREAYTGEGVLVNSSKFNGMKSKDAINEITKHLESKKLGKRTVQYKLKDWLVSRQRYWGTPIPVIYCDKCGIVPISEKNLPVLLPEKVKFGKGNPLLTNSTFLNIKCPKCKGKAKRETDTIDTFFDSSWYFLRYCDNKNKRQVFDKKKVGYWMPVDQYIGGAEHACMHLIYSRFFTKALRDLGFVKFDEPFKKLFNQGMLHGQDGFVMSKSRGNVILPEEVSRKYGIDTARLFLVSVASPDKDTHWSEKGIDGNLRFIKKIFDYFRNVKVSKSDAKTDSKLNETIKQIGEDIENFKYNLAVIKIRNLFNFLPEETSKEVLEKSLKLLHPFCPHITEELWHKLGNKTFISLEKWPAVDESKIDKKIEEQEKQIEKLIEDINHVARLVKDKQNKFTSKAFIYVLPNELSNYRDSVEIINKRTNLNVNFYAVNDKNKYDPLKKASKTKLGKPAVYLE